MFRNRVAQLNPLGDNVVAGSVVARNLFSLQRGGIFHNEGESVFSQNVLMNSDLLVGQTLFVDNIVEYTTGTGVTVEGVLLKDGMVSATALQGINIDSTTPINGQVLGFNGANWIPVNSGISTLLGDVTGALTSNTVTLVGGQTASSIANATIAINNATTLNTPNTLVIRDGSGNFHASSATDFTGSLSGDVTGGQSSTVVEALQGVPVNSTAPTSGQILQYDGSNWLPNVIYPNGTISLGYGAVPNASLLNQVIGIGYEALYNATTGADSNTVLGYQAGITVTTGNSNVIIGRDADVMANMNSFGVAIGYAARTNSNGVSIGNSANTNSVLNAIAIGQNAAPLDANHAISLSINASSVTGVAPGGATSYLGITINGVNYKIAIIADP